MILLRHCTRPKVLFIIGSLNVGGAEQHLVEITPALVTRGYRVMVYCLSERGTMAGHLARAGVEVIGPPLHAVTLSFLGRVGRYLAFGLSALRVWTLMLFSRPVIIHCFLPMANIIGIALGRVALIKIIIATRRSLNRYRLRQPFAGSIEGRLFHRATVVVSNSEAAMRELIDFEGLAADRIKVIHNGISPSRIDGLRGRAEVRKSLNIDGHAIVFIIVANLFPYKGHLDLIAALAAKAPFLPAKWMLLVAGRDEGMGPSILRAAHDGNIDAHVQLLGARSDIAELLQAADIGVLSSHEEGFSTAIVEYMMAGLPVVATDIGGTAEAVSHGVTGFLAPVGDSQSMGTALTRLANDPAMRRQMGEAGRTRALEKFTLDCCVVSYDQLYRDLLGWPPH